MLPDPRSGLYRWMQKKEKRCFLYCVPDEAHNGQNFALIKEVNIAWIEEVKCERK